MARVHVCVEIMRAPSVSFTLSGFFASWRSVVGEAEAQFHLRGSLVFKQDIVPPKIFVDNSKEQILGKFAKKCRKADCHIVTTEPYSP